MRKAFLIIALACAAASIFVQTRAVAFAMGIVDLIREFGKVLSDGGENDEVRDFFFFQAEEIRVYAQDSFIAQQLSLGLTTGSIIFVALAVLMEKKASKPTE